MFFNYPFCGCLIFAVMVKKDSTKAFHDKIRKMFKRMKSKGRRTTEDVIDELAKKHFRSTTTIENIIYGRTKY